MSSLKVMKLLLGKEQQLLGAHQTRSHYSQRIPIWTWLKEKAKLGIWVCVWENSPSETLSSVTFFFRSLAWPNGWHVF